MKKLTTNVQLIKLSSSHERLRTSKILGFCVDMPKIGSSFVMQSEGLEFGVRLIQTSPVKEVNGNIFKTENSEYQLDLMTDEEYSKEFGNVVVTG